jgi:hypothetical protein
MALTNKKFKTILITTFVSAIASIALFSPWLFHIMGGKILSAFTVRLSTPFNQISQNIQIVNSLGNFFFYLPSIIWLILSICIGIGFWLKNQTALRYIVWWFFILLATNPGWLYLPGTGIISNFALIIALYISAGILIGGICGILLTNNQLHNKMVTFLLCVTISFLGVWGFRSRLNDFKPFQSALVTRPDIIAFKWIQNNIPSNSLFLVNTFLTFNQHTAAGSDAGWWLPYYTHDPATLLPSNYGLEMGDLVDYPNWIRDLTDKIQKYGVTNPAVLDILNKQGINYIYIGQRWGRVGNTGPTIEPAQLLSNPNFKIVYNENRVSIYEVAPK